MAKKFSINEAISFGWDTVKKNGGFFVTLLFIAGIINFVPEFIAETLKEDHVFLALAITLFGRILSFIVSMGLIKIVLEFYDNEQPHFIDLFSCFHLFFKYVSASFFYGLICFAGTILLIIPGIIWSIQFAFYGYLIVDKEIGPIQALKKSSSLTRGAKKDLFIFALVFIAINIIGALCFLIGLFITIPVSLVAAAFVYRKLLAEIEGTEAVQKVESVESKGLSQDGNRGQPSAPR